MEDLQIFDGMIDSELHREVYDWISNTSLYTKWIGIETHNKAVQTINEYIPAIDGRTRNKDKSTSNVINGNKNGHLDN